MLCYGFDVSTETLPEAPTEHMKGQGEANSTEQIVDESVEQPEKLANKQFERKEERPFFGKEGIPEQDLRAMSSELKELFKTGQYTKMARELAHLKRAGVELKGKSRDNALSKLKEQAETLQDKPDELASYLTSLKCIGAIKEPTEEQKAIIQEAYNKRLAQNQVSGLSRLCINAKYLKVKEDFGDAQPYLMAEMKRQGRHGTEAGVALLHARSKYLGVPSIVDQGEEQVSKFLGALKVPQLLATLYNKRRWQEFARLGVIEKYLRGQAEIIESVQEKLARGVSEMGERAREKGSWSEYVRYVGDVASLSKSKEVVSDKQVVEWLSEGGKEKTAEEKESLAETVEVNKEESDKTATNNEAVESSTVDVPVEETVENEVTEEVPIKGKSWWGKLVGVLNKIWWREDVEEDDDDLEKEGIDVSNQEKIEEKNKDDQTGVDTSSVEEVIENAAELSLEQLNDRIQGLNEIQLEGGRSLGTSLNKSFEKTESFDGFRAVVVGDEEAMQSLKEVGSSVKEAYSLLNEASRRKRKPKVREVEAA